MTGHRTHTYAWNADGKPITIDSVALTYDAQGRMVEQDRSGTYTQIVYGLGGGKMALMNGQTMVKAFIGLPAGGVAVYGSGGTLSYFRHPDWVGSARVASDLNHNILSDLAYAPYGETYAESGNPDRSFTGQNQDTVSGSTTGLYDFMFREMAQYGRWISPDPIGLAAAALDDPQSLNSYSYVRNSPTNATDPFGLWLCPTDPCDRESGGFGAGPGSGFYYLHSANAGTTNFFPAGMGQDYGNQYMGLGGALYTWVPGGYYPVWDLGSAPWGPEMMWVFRYQPGHAEYVGQASTSISGTQTASWPGDPGSPKIPAIHHPANNGNVPLNPYAQAVFSQPVLQTTAATMTNPCTYVGWTAAAATAGAGGVAVVHYGEIEAVVAENAPTLTSRILKWWFNLTSRPGKPGLVRAAAATAVAAKDAVVTTCKQF